MSRQTGLIALACLLAPALAAAAADKFEVATEAPIREIPFGGIHGTPAWGALSPDGRSVLTTKMGDLTVRPLESADETQLLPEGSIVTVWTRSWVTLSPSGKWIYYLHSADSPVRNDLWRLDPSNRQKVLLIKNVSGGNMFWPQPSPDGKSIAFYRGNGKELLVAAVDGRNERVLCERCAARSMVWSPDSSQILFTSYEEGADYTITKPSLLTVATGQVKPLAPWKGVIYSFVWPAWSSGPFFSLIVNHNGSHTMESMQIWHLSPLRDERAQVTRNPGNRYFHIFGAGTDGHSLVVHRLPPPQNGWDLFFDLFARFVPGASRVDPNYGDPNFRPTVLLTLQE
jgi:dipeptidyl aminopeptidase/acylaminoacyl peptidase